MWVDTFDFEPNINKFYVSHMRILPKDAPLRYSRASRAQTLVPQKLPKLSCDALRAGVKRASVKAPIRYMEAPGKAVKISLFHSLFSGWRCFSNCFQPIRELLVWSCSGYDYHLLVTIIWLIIAKLMKFPFRYLMIVKRHLRLMQCSPQLTKKNRVSVVFFSRDNS